MEKTNPKLVRDEIPAIIEASGRVPITRLAIGAERGHLLAIKLVEEAQEFLESRSLEELADVLEVVQALAAHLGSSMDQIEAKRLEKKAERGGFDRGLVLLSIKS